MSARVVLSGLLVIVAGAAAVLSFAALRDLAAACGFAPRLAWLLPVVIDAGAAAGSLVWLGGWAATPARRFARRLALGLLGLSVAANALGHGLQAFTLAPPWWVVVVVSAIAPAVLGTVVHLAVLVGRPSPQHEDGGPVAEPDAVSNPAGCPDVHRRGVQLSIGVGHPELDTGVSHSVQTPQPGTGPPPGVAVVSPIDRARVVATAHARRHGSLPTVRQLATDAAVSRGTANTALQDLAGHTGPSPEPGNAAPRRLHAAHDEPRPQSTEHEKGHQP